MKMETFSYNSCSACSGLENLSNVSQFVAFSVKRYCEATVHISLCYAFVNCYSIFLSTFCLPLNHILFCAVSALTNTVRHSYGYDADSMGYK